MKLQRMMKSFSYNDVFLKWFWLVVEVLLSSFVGALIAFIFGEHYWAALATFGIIILFLIIICIMLIAFENRVSVLSIMNQGLKDGRYEDVIKFGSAMVPTLFTSNKNQEIILLGGKIDEAAEKIQTAPYNKQKGNFKVSIGGVERTITDIRIEVLIDDIGWPNHLCHQNKEAINSIIAGIKKARAEASRLSKLTTDPSKKEKDIQPYVKMMTRGYRHLTGIFSTDVTKLDQAKFFENITRIIMSNGRILEQNGVCNNRSHTFCPDNVGGLLCTKVLTEKVACIRTNILALYFPNVNFVSTKLKQQELYNFLDALTVSGYMNEADVIQDVELFNAISAKLRIGHLREQCYAWSRNIVKQLQRRFENPSLGYYISDDEIECGIAEASAFAQVYYYGKETVPNNNGRDVILNQGIFGKSELRYLSLLNEISLVELLFPLAQSSDIPVKDSEKIEALIQNFIRTMELCRGTRADLYVRNALHLCETYLIDFNLGSRYSMDIRGSLRKETINEFKNKVAVVFRDIRSYEHKINEEAEALYKRIKAEITMARNEIKKGFTIEKGVYSDMVTLLFKNIDESSFNDHLTPARLRVSVYAHNETELAQLREKWRQV